MINSSKWNIYRTLSDIEVFKKEYRDVFREEPNLTQFEDGNYKVAGVVKGTQSTTEATAVFMNDWTNTRSFRYNGCIVVTQEPKSDDFTRKGGIPNDFN